MDLIGSTSIQLRIYKRASGNPEYVWNNTYELSGAAGPTTADDVRDLLDAFIAAERTIHTNIVEFTKGVASTWAPDSTPYDPESFLVHEISPLLGLRTGYGSALARNVVLHVKRSASFGRSGRLFYRGCLGETDVLGNLALTAQLDTAAATEFNTSVAAMYTDMQAAVQAAMGFDAHMSLISSINGLTHIRPVVGFSVKGVSFFDDDFKYYDRV